MSKKATNDYLQFISDCSKKSGVQYNEAKKKAVTVMMNMGDYIKKILKF